MEEEQNASATELTLDEIFEGFSRNISDVSEVLRVVQSHRLEVHKDLSGMYFVTVDGRELYRETLQRVQADFALRSMVNFLHQHYSAR